MKRKASFSELLVSLCLVASVSGMASGTVAAAELNLKQDLTDKASWTNASSYVENVAPVAGDTILITGGNSNMGNALNLGYGYNVTVVRRRLSSYIWTEEMSGRSIIRMRRPTHRR
ncbi:MAG: hypothetical protein Q4C70_13570 [Planctomycetia bacterium]|nr:hypothetical protein [Planctomycetia bacterium]